MLTEMLQQREAEIAQAWEAEFLATYSPVSARLVKQQTDPHANPMGHILRRDLPLLVHQVLGGMDAEMLAEPLENLCRLRSVQDFSASQSVSFVFLLKKVIREFLVAQRVELEDLTGELLALESRIDNLALYAFDAHAACRERMYQARVNQEKKSTEQLLRQINRRSPGGSRSVGKSPGPDDSDQAGNGSNGQGGEAL